MWLLFFYIVILIAIGVADSRKAGNFDEYVLAGRRRTSALVGASILASVVGASATMGVVGLARQLGAPAFWWLGSGGIGLILSGWLVAGRIRELGAKTLPDVAQHLFGSRVRTLTSVLIVFGWIGIIAAQFVAAARLVEGLSGLTYASSLLLMMAVITIYCCLGGQTSVLRTDALQLGILLTGLVFTAGYLYAVRPPASDMIRIRLVTPDFGPEMVTYFLLVIGSGFMIGPDIFGRYFAAADTRAARRAGMAAGVALIAVSALVTSIGLWARASLGDNVTGDVLNHILLHELPGGIGLLLSLALLSAVVSSADTCLLTASSIIEHDLIRGSSVGRIRALTAGLATLSLFLAWGRSEIIPHLLLAYHIFNCGVVPPLLIGLFRRPDTRCFPGIMAAMVVGGGCGVVASLTSGKMPALAGIVLSAAISGVAILRRYPTPGKAGQ